MADNDDLLADVACVALNRLPPRYIRHEVDFAFYLSERERTESERRSPTRSSSPSTSCRPARRCARAAEAAANRQRRSLRALRINTVGKLTGSVFGKSRL